MSFDIKKFTENISSLSKDGSTKVSATLQNKFRSVVSYGYNGLPRGMKDDNPIYQNKDQKKSIFYKYDLFEHAERNCLYNYARNNTKLGNDGVFAIVSVIKNIEDFRALISIGIKNIYFHKFSSEMSIDNISVCLAMAKETGVFLFNLVTNENHIEKIDDNHFKHVINNTSLMPYSEKKIKQVSDLINESFDDSTLDNQFCAFFNKDFSMISIGVYGFSDYLKHIISEKKLCNNNSFIDMDKYSFTNSNGETIIIGQSAVKNAIYNILAPIFVDNDFKMNVTLQPCIYCSFAMFSCGIWSKNINVTTFSQTSTTSSRWGEENNIAKEFERMIWG